MASKEQIDPALLDAIKSVVSGVLDTGTDGEKDAAKKLIASYPAYLREAVLRFMTETPDVAFVSIQHKSRNGNPDARGPRTVIAGGRAFPKVPSAKGTEGFDFAPAPAPTA